VKVFLIRYSQTARAIRSDNSTLIDMTLVRLIHLLSHHPDFSLEPASLREFSVYINFFLDTIANRENVQFLFHIATRLKQVRDAQSPDKCENIYTLSDLTQHLVQAKCKAHSWPLAPFPGQSNLPPELFKSIPNAEMASEIMKKNYIPNEFLKELEKAHGSSQSKGEKANKKGRPKSTTQTPRKKRKVNAESSENSQATTRTLAPRAAKSKVQSMAIDSDSSENEDIDEDTDDS
ncbi:2741_t:CDS:2, partial [Dentiscutata erythropus]